MNIELGIKSDPIEYRYSFEWLFALMERLNLKHMQLGSFFEMYSLPDRYFQRLRRQAEDHGVHISSCFSSHRELGGLMSLDPDLRQVAMNAYARFLEIGALLGADSVGGSLGSVPRDHMELKTAGIAQAVTALEALSYRARGLGLAALTVEPMSSLAEPPSSPDEIRQLMEHLALHHATHPGDTVPVYLCGDVSHGLANAQGRVVHGNLELFEMAIPWMWEFHLKNTDTSFGSTFGFGGAAGDNGIVDLAQVWSVIQRNFNRFPRPATVAYLEINGPKLGRDYSDPLLGEQLSESIRAIREHFVSVSTVR
jgi:sugar phosphate isomerase/epimerase